MHRSFWVSCICLPLVAGSTAGCRGSRKFTLTFINMTLQGLEVQVSVAGSAPMYAGVAAADGGRTSYKIRIKKASLPVRCAWRAGDLSGQFSITGGCKTIWVNIRPAPPGAPATGPATGPATKPRPPASAPRQRPRAGDTKKAATHPAGPSDKE